MIRKYQLQLVALCFVLLGLLLATTRYVSTGTPLSEGSITSTWQVEAKISFEAKGEPVLASLAIPADSGHYRILEQRAASPGYGFALVSERRQPGQRAEWSTGKASGAQILYYKTRLLLHAADEDEDADSSPPPVTATSGLFSSEAEEVAAAEVIRRARELSSTPASLTRELIRRLNNPQPNQNIELLRAEHDKAVLLQRLLTMAGVAARSSYGLYLEDGRRNQSLQGLVEVHDGKRWLVYSPDIDAPDDSQALLIWQRGEQSLLDLMGAENSSVSFSMIRQDIPTLSLSRQESGSVFALFSIHQLPIEEQSMFKLLLLLPLGALVVVFMRALVGIRTSGTFMPVLIATAFIQTSLFPGLVSFVAIVIIGLLLRSYLSRLNLLLVARIATVIVIVIFIIGLLSLIGYRLGFSTGMTVTLFPIIIIAWTIERMSILWEEDGPGEVLLQGTGSLLVAICAYGVMSLPQLKYLSFNFPELHLVVIGLILWLGGYTGYRLSELYRFRTFRDQAD